jgi:hypothetical protein
MSYSKLPIVTTFFVIYSVAGVSGVSAAAVGASAETVSTQVYH